MDLSVFSSSEAVELILGCYTFTLGFWEDELDKIPEARKFVELGLTQPNEEYPDEYYGSNVPLFRRNGYRQSGTMIPGVRNRDTTFLLHASLLA